MKKGIALGSVITLVVLLTVSIFLIHQFNSFQTQITDLKAQISELKDQNGVLQNQTVALQNQTLQLQDRVKQLLEQLDELYNSPVQIISYEWIGGFNPIGSLTLAYPVNVTLQNKGD